MQVSKYGPVSRFFQAYVRPNLKCTLKYGVY